MDKARFMTNLVHPTLRWSEYNVRVFPTFSTYVFVYKVTFKFRKCFRFLIFVSSFWILFFRYAADFKCIVIIIFMIKKIKKIAFWGLFSFVCVCVCDEFNIAVNVFWRQFLAELLEFNLQLNVTLHFIDTQKFSKYFPKQ